MTVPWLLDTVHSIIPDVCHHQYHHRRHHLSWNNLCLRSLSPNHMDGTVLAKRSRKTSNLLSVCHLRLIVRWLSEAAARFSFSVSQKKSLLQGGWPSPWHFCETTSRYSVAIPATLLPVSGLILALKWQHLLKTIPKKSPEQTKFSNVQNST